MSSGLKKVSAGILNGVKRVCAKFHFLVKPGLWKRYLKLIRQKIFGGEVVIKPFLDPSLDEDYMIWVKNYEEKPKYEKSDCLPLISLLMPVRDDDSKLLKKSIKSLLAQKYSNYEVCIVDNGSDSREIKELLKKHGRNKKIRIKFLEEKKDLSQVLNDALDMAKGEYVALVDIGDMLAKNALYEIANALNKDNSLDLVYSDEDRVDLNDRRYCPNFKPDWSPDTLLSFNYIHRLAAIRAEKIKEVGGFTLGIEGAQDYDLLLKITEKTDNIGHIPKVLYHSRENGDLVSSKKLCDVNKKIIEMALKRRGIKAKVKEDSRSGYCYVVYDVEKEPLVSVIIPTKDYAEVTETCLRSVFKETKYKNYEVIVVNNRSVEKNTFKLFDKYKKKYKNFRVVDADMEFNYSRINNLAVKAAKGEVIILLNNDTKIITPDWMTLMVGYALQSHVGTVGAKLLYPDDTLQHAGVILGLGQSRVAGHGYVDKARDELGMYGRVCVPYNYSAMTAACLCIEKGKYEEVGGLDEKLRIAFNDVDFNLKLLDKGYYNVFLPMVEVYHFESRSRGLDTLPEKQRRFEQEMVFMKKRWKNKLLNDKYYNINYSLDSSFVLKRKEEK